MAKVSYVDPNLTDIDKFYGIVRTAERFSISRLVKKKTFLSATQIEQLKGRSLFNRVSALWKTLDSTTKSAWKAIDYHSRKNGWRMFLKDMSARIRSDIDGIATPSSLHQDWIGAIFMLEGSSHYQIKQSHPATYYVRRKIPGKKSQYEQAQVKEQFYLHIELGINYKSNLQVNGDNPTASFYARVISHYQGRDIETLLKIDLDLSTDWKHSEITLSSVLGEARYYDLFFDLQDVKGELYFDNLRAIHNGQNWVRDPWCDKIEINYNKNWSQIAQNWETTIEDPFGFHSSGYLA